jgi:hypothetical protein
MMDFGSLMQQMAQAGPMIDEAGSALERIATSLEKIAVALDKINTLMADYVNYADRPGSAGDGAGASVEAYRG